MAVQREQKLANFASAVLIGQVAAALFGMAAFLFAPRADQPALVYPVTGHAAAGLPQIISRPGSLIAARGRLPDSYIVAGDRPGFAEALIVHGILVLNAAAPGCGPIGGIAAGETSAPARGFQTQDNAA